VSRSSKIGAVGVGLAVLTAVAASGGGAGPLAWPKDAGTTLVGLPVKTGQIAVTAIPFARSVDAPVVRLAVRPQHAEDWHGLVLRYAATTGRGLSLAGARGWRPSRWDLRPLAGFVIKAHTRGGVVIGAVAAKPGVYLLRGFVVDYRSGGKHYSASLQLEFQVCVERSCPD
jgi:hypothetical protein